jgi:hypothetical protein
MPSPISASLTSKFVPHAIPITLNQVLDEIILCDCNYYPFLIDQEFGEFGQAAAKVLLVHPFIGLSFAYSITN